MDSESTLAIEHDLAKALNISLNEAERQRTDGISSFELGITLHTFFSRERGLGKRCTRFLRRDGIAKLLSWA